MRREAAAAAAKKQQDMVLSEALHGCSAWLWLVRLASSSSGSQGGRAALLLLTRKRAATLRGHGGLGRPWALRATLGARMLREASMSEARSRKGWWGCGCTQQVSQPSLNTSRMSMESGQQPKHQTLYVPAAGLSSVGTRACCDVRCNVRGLACMPG